MIRYAEVHVRLFATTDGGRATPIYPRGRETGSWYMPHFQINRGGELLGVAFVDGPSTLAPGQEGTCIVTLADDGVDYSGLSHGASFEALEGITVVGRGSVLRRWEIDRPWDGLASA